MHGRMFNPDNPTPQAYVNTNHELNALAAEGSAIAMDLLIASHSTGNTNANRKQAANYLQHIKKDGSKLDALKAMAIELFTDPKHIEKFLLFAEGCYNCYAIVRGHEGSHNTIKAKHSV